MSKTAIILCGGKGTRMFPETEEIPKALVSYKGKPIINWQLEWLSQNKIEKIILACGYKWKMIFDYLKDSVDYCIENKPKGTAGALKMAMQKVDEKEAYVINGDIITEFKLKDLKQANSIVAVPFRSPYGLILDVGGKADFKEKPILHGYYINAGIYLLKKDLKLPEAGSLEYDVFPTLNMKLVRYDGFWKAIDTRKDLEDKNV